MIDLNKHKLELTYPCAWSFKLIVLESVNIKKVAKTILSDREHKIKESKVSKKGKYKSYNLDLLVHSDEDRTSLHAVFGEHNDIKMVL